MFRALRPERNAVEGANEPIGMPAATVMGADWNLADTKATMLSQISVLHKNDSHTVYSGKPADYKTWLSGLAARLEPYKDLRVIWDGSMPSPTVANRCGPRSAYGEGSVKQIPLDGVNDADIEEANEAALSVESQFKLYSEMQDDDVAFILQSISQDTEQGKVASRTVEDGLTEDRREFRDYRAPVRGAGPRAAVREAGYSPRLVARAFKRLEMLGTFRNNDSAAILFCCLCKMTSVIMISSHNFVDFFSRFNGPSTKASWGEL